MARGVAGSVLVPIAFATLVACGSESPVQTGAGGSATTSNGVGASSGGAGSGAGASGGVGGGSLAELTLPARGAFFYPWFPETWGSLGDPFSNYEPIAGYYDSSSQSIVDTQLDQLRYAHISFAIASWWGQGSLPDGRVQTLLDESIAHAQSNGGAVMRWTLYVEAEGDAAPWGDPNPSVQQIRSDLDYVYSHYAAHPAFMRLSGKPVLFTWGDSADDCTSATRWTQANDAFEADVGERFYVVMKLFSGYESCPQQPDGWHQYGPATGYHEHLPHSAVVSPGFWLKGDATPLLARDPVRFEADVAKMNVAGANFALVTTFNEWGEGTAVEPAVQWASSSGYGTYLDILHDHPP